MISDNASSKFFKKNNIFLPYAYTFIVILQLCQEKQKQCASACIKWFISVENNKSQNINWDQSLSRNKQNNTTARLQWASLA